MKKTLSTIVLACALVAGAIYANAKQRQPGNNNTNNNQQQTRSNKRPRIDIVIALDTSGSMSGLISSARQKLWDIVNEAARAQPAPILRVGLLTYGSTGSEQDGFVVVRSKLTSNLDSVYSKLFELSTSGGTEYVGRVVHRAVRELNWSKDKSALKQIFVAGNESADQDRTITARSAVTNARENGIFVNAIYCGRRENGVREGWDKVASLGKGVFASIDHNHGTVNITTPYDRELRRLNSLLNTTYVGYGPRGSAGAAMQRAQDKNAARAAGAAAASRTVAKASSVYDNSGWDLVDARKKGRLARVSKDALPAKLRKMNKSELKSYLDKLENKRKSIRKQIVSISKKRSGWLANEMKRQGKSEASAFDGAVRRAVRVQAKAKGIRLKK